MSASKIMKFAVAALFAGLALPAFGETPAQILAQTEAVADWQLAHLDTAYVASQPNDQNAQRGWVYGALFAGITALAERSPDPKYADAVFAHGVRQNWGLEARPFHADDYVIGQSWIWAYERAHDPHMIAAVKARLDAIAAAAPKVPLVYGDNPPPYVESACQLRWCWADALFMGPPAWAELSRATGDPKYLAYADGEYWASVAYLFDRKENMFARDSRFFTRRGPHGEKIFWSRGNGWVYAGLARMLQFLPPDHPSRARYQDLFRKMSERIVSLQKSDGYWPVSLLAPPQGTPPETSGTGFFTFGLAYGVKAGLLPEPRFRHAAARGWAALKAAVHPGGKLGWVQQIGVGPDAVAYDDTQLFGVGAFLLAGSAIYDLAREDVLTASVSTTKVWNAGYALGSINSVSMARNNLVSTGGYQFAAFYGAPAAGRVPLLLARRSLIRAPQRWQVVATPFALEDVFSNTGARDDHNIVAMAIDKNGRLHLSWGMHNVPLAYAVSAASVLGRAFGKLAFKRKPMIGAEENAVTYPEFFQAPDGTLMFTYRNGGAGGGSGNGNQYINAYDAKTKTWRRIASPMVDGISSSMNAYTNGMAYGPHGTLFASWTIRETPDWQTNHDIYLARSPDNGRSWVTADGKALGPTIDRTEADTLAKIVKLPQHSSLINQTGMTIGRDGNPLIATWWAPGAPADNARQYMLVWRDGALWRTSQISQRALGEAYDATSGAVRQMGRPIVLTDKGGRVVVVTRATDSGRPVEDASNKLVVYWSRDRVHWSSIVMPVANPGSWEPVYDRALWQSQNKLSLLFEPVGLGAASSQVSVLTWDAKAYFAKHQTK